MLVAALNQKVRIEARQRGRLSRISEILTNALHHRPCSAAGPAGAR